MGEAVMTHRARVHRSEMHVARDVTVFVVVVVALVVGLASAA